MTSSDNALTQRIEQWLAERMPAVELLACQRVAAERLRLTIDHPDGVDLGLCERVTKELAQLREQYAIEVSSPGPERPLTKPDHFRRFIGRRARVRTRLARAGHRSFTGELVGASDAEVTVAADIGVVSIPYTEIAASNLISRAEASARAGQGGKA